MNKFNKIKESLKRNLKKNKNVGYSKAILIIFLMTGGVFTYSQKEDKYSHQIFFGYRFNSTKNLDNTLFNFNTEEYEKDNLIKNPRRGKGLIHRYGKFFGGNGIVLENVNIYDSISFAANIRGKQSPSINLEKPKTTDIEIENITVNEPKVKDINVVVDNIDIQEPKSKIIQNIEIPVITKINNIINPTNITITSLETVESKNIDSKAENKPNIIQPNINISPKNIQIKPTYISIPTVPDLVTVEEIKVESPKGNPETADPQPKQYAFLNYNSGNLSQVTIKKGQFNVEKDKTTIKDYETVCYDIDAPVFSNFDSTITSEIMEGNKKKKVVIKYGTVRSTKFPVGTKLEFKDGRTATLKFQEDGTKKFVYDDNNQIITSESIPKDTIVKLPDEDYYIIERLEQKTRKVTDSEGKTKTVSIPYEITIKMPDGSDYKTLIQVTDNNTWEMIINLPNGKKATVVKVGNEYKLKNHVINEENSRFFYTLLDAPYAEFSKDVVINFNNSKGRAVINFESQSSVDGNLDKDEENKHITSEKKKYLKDNQEYYGVHGSDNGKTELLFINKGKINLIGEGTTYMVSTNAGGGGYRTNYVDNEGKILANGKDTIILNRTADGGGSNDMVHIFSNSKKGEMYANGENSVVYMTSNGNLHISRSAFINDGLIQLNGKNSIGVFYTDGGLMGNDWKNTNTYLTWIKKPIEIRAEGAKGFVIQNAGIGVKNPKNLFKANILENSKQAIGILQDTVGNENTAVTATKIEINTNASETESKNIGIFANKGTINIVDAHEDSKETDKTSSVVLKNGNGNIGVFATGNNSIVNFKGLLKIENAKDSKNNKLAVTIKGGKVNLEGSIKAGNENSHINNSISLYSSDENSILTLKEDSKKDIYLSGKSYIAYAVNKGIVDIKGTVGNKSNLNLINADKNRKQGIGLVADNEGKIIANYADVTVKYGELGIGALHNSKIDFKNSKLNYTGNGYAIYADENSEVDISSSTVELRDGAVAFEIDGKENTKQNIIMDSKTRIKPMEDGITIFNVKNFTNISTVGGVKGNIINVAKKKLEETDRNISLDNLIDNENNYKYKVAAIDGGVLTVGSIDKSGTVEDGNKKDSENLTDEQKAKRDGYQFYNLLQAQRLKATTVSGSKITALIDSEKAKDFNGQVVAFEMNSSTNAKDNSDTQINLVNTEVKASRTDGGNGAIGLYINYGKVNVDKDSKILVENNTINKNGVGIYSVNGSDVTNNGSITVGGTESVGILAKSYREDDKGVIKDEFGKKEGQGTLNVLNNNKIIMKGANSVGIYADNNNKESEQKDNTVNNNGTIDITENNGIGIYGKNVSISNKDINISNNGIGIYSYNSKLNELGNITFKGDSGVGLYLKGEYDTDLDNKTLKVKSNENTKNNIGVYSEDDIITALKVDATGENVTNYYSKGNINVKSSSKVVKGGIGISADSDKTITYETNDDKSLAISENAIGIYGNKNTIEHKGKISLDGNKSRGIYADSGIVNVNNKIIFNSENSVGVQALNNAIVNIKNEDSINFNENKNNVGYYLSSSNINFEKDIKFKDTHSNIYVYGKDSSTIKFKNATVDGKAIGMYLEGTNKIEGTNLNAINSGIGIYNNGENEISNLKVESKDKGIGIYSEKNIVLNNTTITSDNAVSIYSKGEVNLKTDTNLNLKNKGVGIYLDEKGSLIGSKLNVVSDGSENGVAVYYKGNKGSNRDINNEIDVNNQNNVISTYISDSKVTNKGTININGGKNNVGSFVTDEASFINTGNINLTNVENGNAIYVKSGVAENKGNIKVDSETSIAMVANEGATLKNNGNIVNEKNLAMYLNNGTGENSGTITAKIGVYIKGEKAKFKNSKDIKASNIGIYLEGTKEKAVILDANSKISLTKDSSVGVYSNNSIIDFDIKPDVEGNLKDLVSVYASSNTLINSKISTAKGENSTAIYLNDSSVTFGEKADIDITEGSEGKYNIGIYTGNAYNGNLNINLKAINSNTIGLRVGENSIVNYSGEVTNTLENTIGVLSEGDFTSTDSAKFNITKGVGIYVRKGKTNINGSTFTLSDNAIAIHQEGGELNLNGTIKVRGKGTLLSLKNIDKEINSNINLGDGTNGIVASYDDGKVHKLTLNEGKTITLGKNAVAISAIAKEEEKVTIENKGIIQDNGSGAIGIYAKNVSVLNSGKINTNKGVYLTEKSSISNSGEIILSSNNAIGILGKDLNGDRNFKIGKISSESNENQIGVFIERNTDKLTLKGVDIKLLGSNSKGVIFKNGNTFEIKENSNKIIVGENSVALASIDTNGNIENTDITLGNKGTGVYLKGEKTLSFSGNIKESENNIGSTLVSASDKGTINLDIKSKNLIVSKGGVGLAVINESKINAKDETNITVNGGVGAYINNSCIDKFNINVNEGAGVYVTGRVNKSKMPKVNLNGDNAMAYILKDLEDKFTLESLIVGENDNKNQIGIYAIGNGKDLEVENIKVLGTKNYGIFNKANQQVESKNLNVEGEKSIGIYSDVDNAIKVTEKITTDKGAIGVYKIKGNVINSASISASNSSVGVYAKDGKIELNKPYITVNNGAIGIKADKSNVVSKEKLEIRGSTNSVGIYSLNGGTTTLNKGLDVSGNLMGIYQQKGKLSIKENFNVSENVVGVFGDNTTIENESNLKVSSNAKGIYAEKTSITSKGNVETIGDNAIGIATKDNSKIKNIGELKIFGEKSVGIYGDDSSITNIGKITVSSRNGIGIYNINNDITHTGEMEIKEDAVGIFKKGKGTVTLTSNKSNVLDKGYAVYYEGETKEKSKLVANINETTLGKEAVGVYANNVDIKYTGNIHVGESTITDDGFKNFDNNINSVGIYAKNSKLEYKGTLTIDKPLSVGIYAKDTTDVVIKNGSNVTVSNGAIGVMTSENSKSNITIENGAVFNVAGRANNSNATKLNVSTGVAIYGGILTNNGTFNVSDGALGIYYNENSTFVNNGTFNLTNGGVFEKHIKQEFKLGSTKMILKKNGNITLNIPNKMDFVNSGVMDIDGNINLNGLQLNLNDHMHIDANEFEGVASIKPEFSNGDSTLEYVYKDIFRSKKEKGLGKFLGDVKSQSITWVAKVGKVEKRTLGKVDPSLTESKTKDIIMTRIPYTVLIKGPKYNELAKGLDKVRLGIPKGTTSEIFKSLDRINNYGDLANSIANIRGDMYSNIQERMLDISNEFSESSDELLESNNKTRKVHKLSVIYSNGKHMDNTIGVSSYKRDTIGLLYLNDKENENSDVKFGYSLAGAYSKFNFIGDTSKGSSENVYSGRLGVHYQKEKDNFKFLTRLNLGLNYHVANRVVNILNETKDKYIYNSKYWSMSLDWNNKVSYDININPDFVITPYAKLDLMYYKLFNITEYGKDSTLALNVKANNSFVISPKLGLDVKYDIKLKNDKYVAIKGQLEYRYNVLSLYKNPNKAKFQKSDTLYNLSVPGYRRSSFKVAGEIEFGKKDKWGVSLGASYENVMKYNLRFNYKF